MPDPTGQARRDYQAVYFRENETRGYVLHAEYGDEWAEVPEAAQMLFATEDEAYAFAEKLENEEGGDHA